MQVTRRGPNWSWRRRVLSAAAGGTALIALLLPTPAVAHNGGGEYVGIATFESDPTPLFQSGGCTSSPISFTYESETDVGTIGTYVGPLKDVGKGVFTCADGTTNGNTVDIHVRSPDKRVDCRLEGTYTVQGAILAHLDSDEVTNVCKVDGVISPTHLHVAVASEPDVTAPPLVYRYIQESTYTYTTNETPWVPSCATAGAC